MEATKGQTVKEGVPSRITMGQETAGLAIIACTEMSKPQRLRSKSGTKLEVEFKNNESADGPDARIERVRCRTVVWRNRRTREGEIMGETEDGMEGMVYVPLSVHTQTMVRRGTLEY